MPAEDALRMKHLLEEDVNQPSFDKFIEGGWGDGSPRANNTPYSMGPVVQSIRSTLKLAETFYLDAKMMPLIESTYQEMSEGPLCVEDLPTKHGFLWIPAGLSVTDIRGTLTRIHALTWGKIGNNMAVVYYTDKYDMLDEANRQMMSESPEAYEASYRLSPVHLGIYGFGEEMPTQVVVENKPPFDYPFNTVRLEDGYLELEGWDLGEQHKAPDIPFQYTVAILRLMQETIVSVSDEEVSRNFRRKLERENRPERKVSVIALRKVYSRHHGEHREIEWSHRWVVRGHYRKQPCKDEDGNWSTKTIYIRPYLKGPEDAPLLVREHVYSLKR